MLSRHELETIRAEAESDTLDTHAAETILALLWHIDGLEARPTTGETRRRKAMREAITKRGGTR